MCFSFLVNHQSGWRVPLTTGVLFCSPVCFPSTQNRVWELCVLPEIMNWKPDYFRHRDAVFQRKHFHSPRSPDPNLEIQFLRAFFYGTQSLNPR